MSSHNDIGKWGEDRAAEYMQSRGYFIMDRDWRLGRSKHDLDLVCRSEDMTTVVFVEVKTRSTDYMAPEEAIDVKKVKSIGRGADSYIKLYRITERVRFDIISIVGNPDDPHPTINHIENAFNPLLI